MTKNYFYSFYNDDLEDFYVGIVTAEDLNTAQAMIEYSKGQAIHDGTLTVQQMPDDIPVNSRMAKGFSVNNHYMSYSMFAEWLIALLDSGAVTTAKVSSEGKILDGVQHDFIGFEDECNYYLFPTAAYLKVLERCKDWKDVGTERMTYREMAQLGYLEIDEKGRYTKIKKIEDRRLRLLWVVKNRIERHRGAIEL